jgi:hypothetical protein
MSLASKSKLKPFMDLAKSVEAHIKGIVLHFATASHLALCKALTAK